jgi:hypothetical protein
MGESEEEQDAGPRTEEDGGYYERRFSEHHD